MEEEKDENREEQNAEKDGQKVEEEHVHRDMADDAAAEAAEGMYQCVMCEDWFHLNVRNIDFYR